MVHEATGPRPICAESAQACVRVLGRGRSGGKRKESLEERTREEIRRVPTQEAAGPRLESLDAVRVSAEGLPLHAKKTPPPSLNGLLREIA